MRYSRKKPCWHRGDSLRQITKGAEPSELGNYKRRHPLNRYQNLGDDPDQIRLAIRRACLTEQFCLCAYCCKSIGQYESDCHNEHILSQRTHSRLSLNFENVVASCSTTDCCGTVKNHQQIAITPLEPRCERDFQFNISGTVQGLTDDAKQTITVLNLGDSLQQNKKLVKMRQQAISNFLLSQSIDGHDVEAVDDELLALLIDDLKQPVNGKLQPFAPIIIKALENWIQGNK